MATPLDKAGAARRDHVEVYYSLPRTSSGRSRRAGSSSSPDGAGETVDLTAPLDPHSIPFGDLEAPGPSPSREHWPGARWLYEVLTQIARGLPRIIEFAGPPSEHTQGEEKDSPHSASLPSVFGGEGVHGGDGGVPVPPRREIAAASEEVLVLERPDGKSLWDAWDDVAATAAQRFGWLRQIAELLHELVGIGVVVEALAPEMFIVTAADEVILADLTELMPLPIPSSAAMKGALSTAPELILAPELADGRSVLYPFGALIYALHHGRELTEMDFDAHGVPRPLVSVFPECHPLLARIVLKTFTRHVENRFPIQEDDPDRSGLKELCRVLAAGESAAVSLRLDVTGWSSTGLMRAANEDAFSISHTCAWGQEHCSDQALIILADGMGGQQAGEVASALAIAQIRHELAGKAPFSGCCQPASAASAAGSANIPLAPHQEGERGEAASPGALGQQPEKDSTGSPALRVSPYPPFSITCDPPNKLSVNDRGGASPDELAGAMKAAMEAANLAIHSAAEQGDGGQVGMGCTCEAVWISDGMLVLAHVGDSRSYLYRQGHLQLLTRDQTMVNRMVALGLLSPEEAQTHPRRHELDQALGSSHPIQVEAVWMALRSGDIFLCCSDGLTTHVSDRHIAEVLRNTSSAEMAARQLVNLANSLGGSDNITVVVARVA